MLTFIMIGIVLMIAVVAVFAYSSKTKRNAAEQPARVPKHAAASIDVSGDEDRRRAMGEGDD